MQNKNNNLKNKNFLSLFDKIKNTDLTKNRELKKKNLLEVISYRNKELINFQNIFFKKRLSNNKELNNNNNKESKNNTLEITNNQKNKQFNEIKKIKIPILNLSHNKSNPKTKTKFLSTIKSRNKQNKNDNNFSSNNKDYSSISINLYNTFNKFNNSFVPSKDLSLNNNNSTNSKTILKTNNSGDSISNQNYKNVFYNYNKINTTKFKCYENNATKQLNNLYKYTSVDNKLFKHKKINKNKLEFKNKFFKKIKKFFDNSNESNNNNLYLYTSRTNLSNGNNYYDLDNSDNTSFYKEIKNLEYQNELAQFHLKKIIKDWHYVPVVSSSFNNDIEDLIDKRINYLKNGKYEVKSLIKNESFKKIFKNYWKYNNESKFTKNIKNNQRKKIELLKEKIRKECVNAERIKLKIKFKKNENFVKKFDNFYV